MFESIIPDWYSPSRATVIALEKEARRFYEYRKGFLKNFFERRNYAMLEKYEALYKINRALWNAAEDAESRETARREVQAKLCEMEWAQREAEDRKKFPPEKYPWRYSEFYSDGGIPF